MLNSLTRKVEPSIRTFFGDVTRGGFESGAVPPVDFGSVAVHECDDLGGLESVGVVVEHGGVTESQAVGCDGPAVGTGEVALEEEEVGVGSIQMTEFLGNSLEICTATSR